VALLVAGATSTLLVPAEVDDDEVRILEMVGQPYRSHQHRRESRVHRCP
jgi:hypothetical protein